MRRWFLPESPDLLAVLQHQGDVTVKGVDAFARWSSGAPHEEAVVRKAEHEADEVRRELLSGITKVFVAPISPEDLFELSERLDVILNAAKNAVSEADVLAMEPDVAMGDMAAQVSLGVHRLVASFPHLTKAPERATTEADAAVRHRRDLERVYRRAMSALLDVEGLREVMGRRELYRRYARIGDAIEAVANRVWYAVVKSA